MVPAFGADVLTPMRFLDRSALVFGDRTAVVDGDLTLTYAELRARCRQLAGALVVAGVERGDRVSVLAPNSHVALEAHYGVPWAGAVLNALNTRLAADELTYIVQHAGSEVLICDRSLVGTAEAIAAGVDGPPLRVVESGATDTEYEQLLREADASAVDPDDEWDLLSLNYTSGTTGRPKGVMYAHRGAYLQSLAMMAQAGLDPGTVFLWTLPMFHCNGWCYPWAVTAAGGVHVALRDVSPEAIWSAITTQGVTHFNAAPTVLTMLAAHGDASPPTHRIRVATGGAPPSPTLLRRLNELGIDVTHLYGLTETYGPAVICDWRPEWDELPDADRAARRARQGVANVIGRPVRVVDEHGDDVPADGSTRGEVVLRGNNVMLGYFCDPDATAAATLVGEHGRWFRTGDVGVLYEDNYVELVDRAKDVIISGGENIASIEVERVLDSHPAVLESAVVADADELWGEVPVAFVALKPDAIVTEQGLIEHVRARIARFKVPKRIVFGELPKTGTGKIQKFVLRERLRRG